MKIKLHVNLQEVNTILSGIGVFENELTMRLMKYPDLHMTGAISCLKGYNAEDYKRFEFPVKRTRFPARYIFDYTNRKNRMKDLLKVMPFLNYNTLVRDRKSDIFLFFSYQVPVFPVKGKVVACIHDLIPFKTEMENIGIIDNYRRNLENTIKRSDCIITVSENSKKEIMEYFSVPEERIHIVYDGVDVQRYDGVLSKEISDSVVEKYNLPKKYILYFGSNRKHKNVETVVNAYAKLDEAVKTEYSLVLSNPSNDIQQLVRKLNLENNVTYVERVSEQEKVVIYQKASLFVLVSFYEGFGIPLLEAMAASVPVITSNCSSLPEVAGDAAILVDPHDVDCLKEKMTEVLYSVELRNQLIEKGHQNIKRFNWDSAASSLHEILLEVASK